MKKLLTVLLFSCLALSAQAANVDIPGLPAASSVGSTDLFECSQGGVSDKCTAAQVKTFANTSAVRATTTTSEAIANSDQSNLVTFSNASAVAATIAQAGGGGNFAAGWAVSLKNLGAGTVTLTPATSTVDGAATVTLTTGQGLDLYSNGTNYFTQPGKGASAANPTATASDTAVNGSAATFMRSDGAPAVQKGTNAQFGLAEGDGASIDLTAGVASRRALTGDVTAPAGSGVTTLAAGSASNLNSGTLPAGRMPALTGDCTTSAGAVAITCTNAIRPQYKASNWYMEFGSNGIGASTVATVASTAYFAPIFFPKLITIQSLSFSVIGTSANNCRLGLFSPDATDPTRPGTLVAQVSADMSTAVATIVTQALSANAQLLGLYYKGIVCSGVPTFSGSGGTTFVANQIMGSATAANIFNVTTNSNLMEISVAYTYAAFPSSMSPSGSTCGNGSQACTYSEARSSHIPLIGYLVNSIP